MKKGDIVYFKCSKETVERYFCIKVFTDNSEVIDTILNQLGKACDDLGLIFVEKEEFDENTVIPWPKNIIQDDIIVGAIISDFI